MKKLYSLDYMLLAVILICTSNLCQIYGLNIALYSDRLRIPLQLSIIVLLVIELIKHHRIPENKSKIFIITVLFLVHILFVIAFGNILNLNVISNGLFGFMLFLLAYMVSRKKDVIEFERWIYLFVGAFVLMFLYFQIKIPSSASPYSVFNAQYQGRIYYLIFLLPFILCQKKNKLTLVATLLIAMCVMISPKQTSIIAFALGLVVYIVSRKSIEPDWMGKQKSGLILAFLIGLIVVSFSLSYFEKIFNINIFENFLDIRESRGNGRYEIYVRVISLVKESNFVHLIFGNGYDGVSAAIGISAHNDFFEIVYDYGILGFVLFMLLFIQIIKKARDSMKQKKEYAPAFLMSITFFVVVGMFSHLLFILKYAMLLMLFWGIILNYHDSKEKVGK